MDNFWDYDPDYTSSGSDLSGDWGGYDQIYVDGNTGGLTDYGSFWDSPDYSYGDEAATSYDFDLQALLDQQQGYDQTQDYSDIPNVFNWGGFDTQAADYLRSAYPELMSSDDALSWEINAMGQDDLYRELAKQVSSGIISPSEAEQILGGKTSTGESYDFSSPEQSKAQAAQRQKLSGDGYSNLLKSALQKQALDQLKAKQSYVNSGVGQALSGLSLAAMLAKALKGKNQGTTISSRSNSGVSFSPTYVGSSAPKTKYATGGGIKGKGGLLSLAEQMAREIANQKGLVSGKAGGQDDVVDIKAAPGEYMMDAEVVSALGDGNNEEGARKLDQMRMNIRKHKRSGGLSSIPPKAKKPEQYMKGK